MAFTLKFQRGASRWLIRSSLLNRTNPCTINQRHNLSNVTFRYGKVHGFPSCNGQPSSTRLLNKRFQVSPHVYSGHQLLRCSLHTETIPDVQPEIPLVDQVTELTGPAPSCLDDPEFVAKIIDGLNFDFDMHTNYDLGLGSALTPVGWVQNTFEMFHYGFGNPWMASIVFSTILVRFIFFPIVIRQGLIVRQKMDALGGWDVMDPLQRDQLLTQNNISGPKILALQIFHVSTWMTFYLAIKKMIECPVPGWTTGGVPSLGWCRDITVPDPLFILPCVATFTSLLLFKISTRWKDAEMRKMAYASLGLTIVPACLSSTAFLSFWITSNVLSIVQASLIKFPRGRKFLGIPEFEDFSDLEPNLLPPGKTVEL
jgi:hypothetical protein